MYVMTNKNYKIEKRVLLWYVYFLVCTVAK